MARRISIVAALIAMFIAPAALQGATQIASTTGTAVLVEAHRAPDRIENRVRIRRLRVATPPQRTSNLPVPAAPVPVAPSLPATPAPPASPAKRVPTLRKGFTKAATTRSFGDLLRLLK